MCLKLLLQGSFYFYFFIEILILYADSILLGRHCIIRFKSGLNLSAKVISFTPAGSSQPQDEILFLVSSCSVAIIRTTAFSFSLEVISSSCALIYTHIFGNLATYEGVFLIFRYVLKKRP